MARIVIAIDIPKRPESLHRKPVHATRIYVKPDGMHATMYASLLDPPMPPRVLHWPGHVLLR